MSNQLLGDVKVEERVQTVTSKGSDPAFFSCWDMHSYYGESYIVQGINFDIREGEVVALLGRNGAGKTSTLRSIARVDSPQVTHGEIWLDHKPLHTMAAHDASQNGVALVPEDRRIIQGLKYTHHTRMINIIRLHAYHVMTIKGDRSIIRYQATNTAV